jgi:hypothetical protein
VLRATKRRRKEGTGTVETVDSGAGEVVMVGSATNLNLDLHFDLDGECDRDDHGCDVEPGERDDDPASDVEPGESDCDTDTDLVDLTIKRQWLDNLDRDDPHGYIGDGGDGNDDELDNVEINDGLTYQTDAGKVYQTREPPEYDRYLGTCKELSKGKKNHLFHVYCSKHLNCKLMLRARDLPLGFDTRAQKWLLHGLKYQNRSQGSNPHMKDKKLFFPAKR